MGLTLSYKIPAISESFSGYSSANISSIKNAINEIKSDYGNIISNVSKITNVNSLLIKSFIFIESRGNQNAISPAGAVGLMQLMPTAASDILVLENLKKRLRPEEKAILTKYLGDRFTEGILNMKYLGQKVTVGKTKSSVWVTKEDLLKPELNILIGSIYLGLLVAEESKDGKLRLDRVALRYNRGYFTKIKKGTIEEVVKSDIPKESKDYILKLAGKNGVLDAIV